MPSKRNENSIEIKLLNLVECMVLEPRQKKIANQWLKKMLHATKVEDVKDLKKAMDKFLETLLDVAP
jgi:hypothetical protein